VDRRDQIAVGSILKAGRHMGRDRYQEGRVVLVFGARENLPAPAFQN
jgi:hypothetical protein